MKGLFITIIFVFYFIVPLRAQEVADSDYLKRAEQHYQKGKEYFLNKDYIKANEEFKKAEEILAAEENKKSTVLKNASSKNTIQKKSSVKRKMSFVYKPENVMDYLKLLEVMPGNPDIHYNLGILYLRRNDYFDAAQEFMQAVRLNPQDADACYNLGILYEIFLNDKKMAVFYYRKYLEINPEAQDRGIVESWIKELSKDER